MVLERVDGNRRKTMIRLKLILTSDEWPDYGSECEMELPHEDLYYVYHRNPDMVMDRVENYIRFIDFNCVRFRKKGEDDGER